MAQLRTRAQQFDLVNAVQSKGMSGDFVLFSD